MKKIFDLSHWNWPNGVNIQPLIDYGAAGLIFKATQGTWYKDPTVDEAVYQSKNAGIPYNLYHFLDPIQDGMQDGNQQFEFFMDSTVNLRSDVTNMLDGEWQGDLIRMEYTVLVLDFLTAAGNNFSILYSNLNFLNNIILQPDDIASHADIMLAWPVPSALEPRYPIHYPKSKVPLWQKSWTYRVPGMDDPTIDMSVVLDDDWFQRTWKPSPTTIYPVSIEVPKSADTIQVSIIRI